VRKVKNDPRHDEGGPNPNRARLVVAVLALIVRVLDWLDVDPRWW
jgi:hypothetical protein